MPGAGDHDAAVELGDGIRSEVNHHGSTAASSEGERRSDPADNKLRKTAGYAGNDHALITSVGYEDSGGRADSVH